MGGLDDETVEQVLNSDCKVALVFQKIQNLVIANMKTGILTIPPVILGRAIGELSNALMKFHEAEKLLIPFPRPYVLVQRVLLLAFACLTPLWMTVWTQTVLAAFSFTFLLVSGIWGLTSISAELDKPFNHKTLDFETRHIQKRLNASIQCTLDESHGQLPTLSPDAVMEKEQELVATSSTIMSMVKRSTTRNLAGVLSSSERSDKSDRSSPIPLNGNLTTTPHQGSTSMAAYRPPPAEGNAWTDAVRPPPPNPA